MKHSYTRNIPLAAEMYHELKVQNEKNKKIIIMLAGLVVLMSATHIFQFSRSCQR